MSYKTLNIWKESRELVIAIHKLSMGLPRHELYETGSQIRRSMKSVKSNIVEGYGRRKYLKDYIRFIIYSLSSNDETIDHLEMLFETGSLKDEKLYLELHEKLYLELHEKLNKLGIKINNFLFYLEKKL